MTDFLLELYSEEIPAGMQARGVSDLARLIRELLADSGIDAVETSTYVAPQRMAVIIAGLPARTPDRYEQKKGPRVDAPERAIQGFCVPMIWPRQIACKCKTTPRGHITY